jgi:hypothetical protein
MQRAGIRWPCSKTITRRRTIKQQQNRYATTVVAVPFLLILPLLQSARHIECSWVCDLSSFTIVNFLKKIALAPAVLLFGDDGEDDEEEL